MMGLGATLGLPLFLLLPILLIGIGVGIYLIVTLMPFIIAGAVFVVALLVARELKIRQPWEVVLPMLAGLVALFPYFTSSLALSMASASSSVSGQSIPGAVMAPAGIFEIALFLVIVALSIWMSYEKKNGKPLATAFLVGFFLLLAGSAFGASAGASTLAVDGATPSGFDSLLVVLPATLIVLVAGYRMDWFER
jgi:hypothetical protein